MNFSEKWGTDVDEAVRLALVDLKVTIDDVDVTVLEEPSKGFFGLGSKLAKVRVTLKEKIEEKPVDKVEEANEATDERKNDKRLEPRKNTEKKNEKHFSKTVKEEKAVANNYSKVTEDKEIVEDKAEMKSDLNFQEKPTDLVDVEEHAALAFLKEITLKMGLELEIKAQQNESFVYVDIEGKDAGTVIGKRGQTLDAIQYLTSLVVNKEHEKYQRVVVDAENYRVKREKTLVQLANRLADKVIRTRRSVRLEPMNPYERKVIHATLQGNGNVRTKSEGEEPYRRVVIELK